MSNVDVKIDKTTCPSGAVNCITVLNSNGVKNMKITARQSFLVNFENTLKTEARVFFYHNEKDKGQAGQEIKNFCAKKNNSTLETSPLKIPPGVTIQCKMTRGRRNTYTRRFVYLIQADGYEELDPVIIIKPKNNARLIAFFVFVLGLSIWGIRELLLG